MTPLKNTAVFAATFCAGLLIAASSQVYAALDTAYREYHASASDVSYAVQQIRMTNALARGDAEGAKALIEQTSDKQARHTMRLIESAVGASLEDPVWAEIHALPRPYAVERAVLATLLRPHLDAGLSLPAPLGDTLLGSPHFADELNRARGYALGVLFMESCQKLLDLPPACHST